MNTPSLRRITKIVSTFAILSISLPVMAGERVRLISAIPDDVFLCVTGQHNSERAFLDKYWGEVFDTLVESGVADDALGLISSLLGEEQRAEMDRLKEHATKLIKAVDWKALGGGEIAFAERLVKPTKIGNSISMGPPEMVFLARGANESAPANFEALAGILAGFVDEINKASGKDALSVQTSTSGKTKVASVNFLASVPNAPGMLTLSVTLHDDVLAITLGEQIRKDVLTLMTGGDGVSPMSASKRYAGAFVKLPKAEDSKTFFDMQVMLNSMREMLDTIMDNVGPGDHITNAHKNEEADKLADQGVEAYREKDYKAALDYTQQANKIDADDSRIMFNLACFHAMLEHEEEALTWLEKAVDGGFYAPKKIRGDGDLRELRAKPRFTAVVEKAKKKAIEFNADNSDVAVVKTLVERLFAIPMMVDYVATVEYTDGYSTHIDELTVLVDGASEKPFYPVIGKRMPIVDFARYLPEETVSFSVTNGIDFNELYKFVEDSVRLLGPQGTEALEKWDTLQTQFGLNLQDDILALFEGGFVSATVKMPTGDATVLMVKVVDEDKVRERIASVLPALAETVKMMAQQQPMLAMLAIHTTPNTHESLPGFHNVSIGMMPQPAVCGVADGYLILASTADAAALCLATAAGKHPNIRKNERFQREGVVPEKPCASISFTDQRKMGREMAAVIGAMSMIGGMASAAIPDPEARNLLTKALGITMKLAPVVNKIDFYVSTASASTFNGHVLLTKKVTNYRKPEAQVTEAAARE